MPVVLNPYAHQKAQLGVIESGLKTLKHDKSYVVGTHWNRLDETIPMCINKIGFKENAPIGVPVYSVIKESNSHGLPDIDGKCLVDKKRPVSGIQKIKMERKGYLDLHNYIMEKREMSFMRHLMCDAEFSDMYNAVEQHHRDLRLAHLTGKAKDLMDQAEKDTKFYNILIKMMCEIKKLPSQKQKESMKKVRLWYIGNRHTLATGPRFGKQSPRVEDTVIDGTFKSRTPSAKHKSSASKMSALSSARSNKENKGIPKSSKSTKSIKSGEFQQFVTQTRDDGATRDDVSSPRGFKGSEPASSRLSMSTDFMTNRFLMELPASKLSWHMESPTKSMYDGGASIDWEGLDPELQRVADSSLSRQTFDGGFHLGQPSVPNSSPNSGLGDGSPRSVGSGDSGGNFSSNADVGSTDMVDFHSEVRRGLSRGQTSGGSLRNGMSEDQSSTAAFGLQRKMVHSIASLVNPHAKLAESEAKKAEQEYREQHNPPTIRSASQLSRRTLAGSAKSVTTDLSAHIPVLRTVNVSNDGRASSMGAFNSFRSDHLFGQDILSVTQSLFRSVTPVTMPELPKGKLNFVGRSGTALDVRYSAHHNGDMPENHTREIIQLYNMHSRPSNDAIQTESQIHNQSLEEFYQAAENYYPTNLPKYSGISRTQSAPAQRIKSAKTSRTGQPGAKTAGHGDRKISTSSSLNKVTKPQSSRLGKNLLENGHGSDQKNDRVEEEDEILYTASRPTSAVKLDSVVELIDHVKDEMNFFKERLAPTPMPGFRQPASTTVSHKPLSRPTSTASRASRKIRARSPSPQGRPSTPMEAEDMMMGVPEVPSDTYKPYAFPARPHSATVSKAVDWRGKITPEAARIRSKTRFGGHTYVQKLKPSLRTAGAVSAGSRPKTAPVPMRDKWNVKDKEEKESIKLPEVHIQNYPGLVVQHPSYPVKQISERSPPLITITECDKNERVAQAASNNVTQIDDKDMDRIMSIQHLMGSSDSRYGSMGSLFLDEDFLRSLNARYNTHSSLNTTGTKEYISFIGPMGASPRSANESRAQSRHSAKRPEISQIPEETTYRDEDTYAEETEDQEPYISEQNESPITQTEGQEGVPEVDTTEAVQSTRDNVKNHDEDVHIEVTSVPAAGKATNLPSNIEAALQGLSKSEVWQYQPDDDQEDVDNTGYFTLETSEGYDIGGPDSEEVPKRDYSDKNTHAHPVNRDHFHEHEPHHHHHQHHHHHETSPRSKSTIKPENYCFHCLPDGMTTKVGRSAGRMPGGPQTPAGQVLRMARKQNDLYKKNPPVRTPPSIPSPHHSLGGRTPRQGQQYSTELEHHARHVKSPRHYMEQVVELRKDNCRSAPPGLRPENSEDIMGSMSVISLQIPTRAQTAPTVNSKNRVSEHFVSLPSHIEVDEKQEDELQAEEPVTDREPTNIEMEAPPTSKRSAPKPAGTSSQSLAHIGRPIAQVSHIPDPEEEALHVMKQKEAKAAVDIQRIFRGYVCRNSYNKLLWDTRKRLEDQQLAQNERDREYRKHQGRKAKIYSRPPLDPALIEWAKDFKSIQVENSGKRQGKIDNMAKEMLANQQKAKSKIEVIGPHVEIYDIYHPKETGPSKRDMHKAAVKIQQHIRGFLVRRRFEKLRRKATFCGTTWDKIVKEYKHLIIKVQRWHNVDKPVTPFSLQDMHEYMDMRRRYESQFDKKSFGEELELNDLESFFRECDLYPSKLEIEEGMDVTTQGKALKRNKGLTKQEAMNLLFYIYCPRATGLVEKRPSTWMNPIINGVEAKKLIGSEYVESAPLQPCADLVINSMKERRDKEEAEKARLRELERDKGGDSGDSEDDLEDKKKVNKSKVSIVVGKGKVGR